MNIAYKVISEEAFLILKFSGDWNTKDYIDFAKMMMSGGKAASIKKILTDLRQVNIDYTLEELEEVINFRDQSIKYDYVNVHLVNNPDSTASTHLYQEELNKRGHSYNYCISIEYALELLDLQYSPKEIERILGDI